MLAGLSKKPLSKLWFRLISSIRAGLWYRENPSCPAMGHKHMLSLESRSQVAAWSKAG